VVAIAWQLLDHAVAAGRGTRRSPAFNDGVARACAYWFRTELPTVAVTLARARSGETSFADASADSF
jgi:Acetyl-CoA dehydrogenase C-terminal like